MPPTWMLRSPASRRTDGDAFRNGAHPHYHDLEREALLRETQASASSMLHEAPWVARLWALLADAHERLANVDSVVSKAEETLEKWSATQTAAQGRVTIAEQHRDLALAEVVFARQQANELREVVPIAYAFAVLVSHGLFDDAGVRMFKKIGPEQYGAVKRALAMLGAEGRLGPESADIPIEEKVAHVRAAKQTRNHGCHWPDCKNQCPPAAWGCRAHWFRLPKRLRDKVWATYRPGQESRMDPSDEYLAVAHEVQDWIAEFVRRNPESA